MAGGHRAVTTAGCPCVTVCDLERTAVDVIADRSVSRLARMLIAVGVALVAVAISTYRLAGEATLAGAPPRVGDLAELEAEARVWDIEKWVPQGEVIRPVLRSGAGLAALVSERVLAAQLIILRDMPRVVVTGGRINEWVRDGTPTNAGLGHPVDVVGVTPQGTAWFLDSAGARVVSRDISGRSELITTLPRGRKPFGGCALDSTAIAYIDAATPDFVFVHRVDGAPPARALPFPGGYADGRNSRWRDLRFGGSLGGHCVLWAPHMPVVLVVTDTGLTPVGPFVEPVPRMHWYHHLSRWIWRRPPPVYVLDATSVPGAIAVLYAGRTKGAGRIVDLYGESGAYLQTMVLRAPTLRVAGNRERLYALRQGGDTVLFASYVLPWSVRAAMRADSADRRPSAVDGVQRIMTSGAGGVPQARW